MNSPRTPCALDYAHNLAVDLYTLGELEQARALLAEFGLDPEM
jgi:hypothetical protein